MVEFAFLHEGRLASGPAFSLDACWSVVCPVDVTPTIAWLEQGHSWPTVAPTKPQRIFQLPMDVFGPLIDAVLAHFPEPVVAHQPMLSRVRPGQNHPLHVDTQRADWLTRIHIPLTTNANCWLLFEDEGEKVHFATGAAYTFNTLKRHAFGNDGATERVHLLFDVLRKD